MLFKGGPVDHTVFTVAEPALLQGDARVRLTILGTPSRTATATLKPAEAIALASRLISSATCAIHAEVGHAHGPEAADQLAAELEAR